MKTLNKYVTRAFLLTFAMAIGLLTFAMLGARMVDIIDHIAQGIPLKHFFQFALYTMPVVLTFTVPWAILVAVSLVFGRLSADSEITAMRACGISILQIVSPVLVVAFLMTLVCLYLQVNVGPKLLGESRMMISGAVVENPIAIFEPGRQVQFENNLIYIDDKVEGDRVKNIQIFTMDDKSREYEQDITAANGRFLVDHERQILTVELFDCMIRDRKSKPETRAYSEKVSFSFNYGQEFNKFRIGIKPKYMTMRDLLARIHIDRKLGRDTTSLEVEMNQRIAFALSPIAFILLGLPLAIRTSRRETSVGIFLSVVLGGFFFLSIILCESLTSHPALMPQYLLWLPNLIYQIGGAIMIYRIVKH